ncbi:hypothetical protein GDO81_010443 [Engystomops pustulosus]|uniref:Secreted protein n=1 Tax=Engystomops pustulosus TaxID=76066 RepID=A0AAV7C1I1_ENGPU|nr:hypothetical protein GDO81_010443 [Engystomops pustulosus]
MLVLHTAILFYLVGLYMMSLFRQLLYLEGKVEPYLEYSFHCVRNEMRTCFAFTLSNGELTCIMCYKNVIISNKTSLKLHFFIF